MKKLSLMLLVMLGVLFSCSKDDDLPQPQIVTADFETNLTVEQNQAVITLSNTSKNATAYEWSFPKGMPENSTEENPTVTYTQNGIYTITLVASNDAGTDTKTVEITVEDDDLSVTADFETNLVIEQNQAVITLSNTSKNATTYEWSFPEGTPENSTEENPTVTYTQNGTYTITLVASNDAGTDTKTVEITVEDDDLSVTADFETNLVIEQNQAVITLSNMSKNATTYEWSFPEGTPEDSTEENPTVTYTQNGTYTITLVASNGTKTDTKSFEITVEGLYIPYRYLENDGIFMYYETENAQAYESLLPDEFDMPSRLLVYTFINDFYELDYGATPYKENAIFILADYQGEEVWHCVYMPVTDIHSVWAGVLGLGLPKTLGEVDFIRESPLYYGNGIGALGGEMSLSVNTENFTVSEEDRQEMIDLSLLRYLNIRNGEIIEMGKTGQGGSVIETAETFPNLMSIEFGEAAINTNTDAIPFNHPLDLTPSNIIGAYYLLNKIPFSLTGG